MESDHFVAYSTRRREYTEYLVAGGGLGNGNAYATVEEHEDRIIFREYGNNPYEEVYEDHHIVHDEDGGFTIRRN